MLTAAELAALRAVQAEALPDECSVMRATETETADGGVSHSRAAVATVACRLGALGRSGEERVIAERLSAVTGYVVTLPAETDVRAEDRLTIGARTFEVAAVLATGAWETARRVAAVEIL